MVRSQGSRELTAPHDADPRYAWVMLPLAMLIQIGTSPGQTFGISLFNEPIRQSLGMSHSMLTGSYLVASLLAAIPLIAIGRAMDRYGLRRVTLSLVALMGLACLVIGQVESIVGLTVSFFMLRLIGQGGLSLAASNTLGMWFVRRLGMASGIAGIGMSAAIAVLPLTYYGLIENLGWRTAYMAIGLFTWVLLLPLLGLLYHNNPGAEEDASGAADDSPIVSDSSSVLSSLDLSMAMRTPAYWIAAGCTAITGMICTAIFFNLVPLFQQQGLTAAQAASIYPTVAIAMAVLQVKGGLLADYLPVRWLLAAAMTSLGAGVWFLDGNGTLLGAQIAAALIGAGQGLMAVTGNTLWPRYFGRRYLGLIRSSVWTAGVAACSAGPFLMGVTLDLTGGYGPSLRLFVGLAGVAAIASAGWAVPPAIATGAPSREEVADGALVND
ncbi:MAG: MFS transporter [Aeoliella sp.]